MARRSGAQDLIRLSARLPWWGALLVALGIYLLAAHVIPGMSSGNPLIVALQPTFRMVGLVLAGLCCLGAVVGLFERRRDRVLFDQARTIEAIRALDWAEFEQFMCEAFRRRGYVARATEPGPDGGVDIRLSRDRQAFLVQCKQWRNRKVGVRPVRELAGIVAAESAAGGIFVCSGDYTAEARRFAAESGVVLVDGHGLAGMLDLTSTTSRSSGTESCPKCGGELLRRLARRGPRAGLEFIGCSNFPRCRFARDCA